MSESFLELKNIYKSFDGFRAVDGVNLSVRKGEFFALLGPSGCGKTTLLRIISGLESPSSGQVLIAGRNMEDVPANLRPVNTVFQSYALFPHLNVEENIGFGLKMKKIPTPEIKMRVGKMIEIVQLTQFAKKEINQLSGGQKQRVALARALVNEPEVLLLDEPLGALDLKLRKELQLQLIALHKELGTTFICVTHDQEEALSMASRIAVMNNGKIEQLGDGLSLYEFPRNRYVSNFLGKSNLIEGTVAGKNQLQLTIQTALGTLQVINRQNKEVSLSEKVTLAIRPEKILLKSSGINCLKAKISGLIYTGSETHYQLSCNGLNLSAEVMNSEPGSQGFTDGQEVCLDLPQNGFIILDD